MPTFNGLNTRMFRASVVNGAAAATNIAVPGIAVGDVLLAVLHQDTGGLFEADRSTEAAITSAGNVQLAATNTTGDKLVVLWLDVSQAES